MGNVAAQLGRTLCTGAAQKRAFRVLHYRRTADRASFGKKIWHSVLRPFGKINLQDFRNNLTGFPNQNSIANPDIPFPNEVLIMKGCIGDGGSGQTDRAHNSLGRENTGSANLNYNILHHGGLDFRGVFVGGCPPGEFCGVSQLLSQSKVIHLYHGTVDIAGQKLPVFVDGENFLVDRLYRIEVFVGNHLEFQGFQILQRFLVAGEGHTLGLLNIEDIDIQPPLCGNLWVQLAQRAGSSISGVCKQRLLLRFLLLVQLLKALFGHEYLTPDDEMGRGIRQNHGNGSDGFQIFRYILPYLPITPGGTPNELSVNILQCHGKAVDFWLY